MKEKKKRDEVFAVMKNTDLFEVKITRGEVGTVFSVTVVFIVWCIL